MVYADQTCYRCVRHIHEDVVSNDKKTKNKTIRKMKKTIFISYAHEDRKWVDELSKFIKPWLRKKRVRLWDDHQIQSGDKWEEKINTALEEANVAVLIVTKDFFNSNYITNHELPKILEKNKDNEFKLFWIAAGYSPYKATTLNSIQAANDPENPLESMTADQVNKTLSTIANSISEAALIGSFANALDVIDDTTEPMQAYLENRPERKDHEFGIKANYEAQKDIIRFRGSTQIITAKDFVNLPEEDQEFIADHEDSLTINYKRWKAIKKQLGVAGGALDNEVQSQLNRIIKLICDDLNHILNFLRDIHKFELEDHYSRYRYLCRQINNK